MASLCSWSSANLLKLKRVFFHLGLRQGPRPDLLVGLGWGVGLERDCYGDKNSLVSTMGIKRAHPQGCREWLGLPSPKTVLGMCARNAGLCSF